MFMAVSRDCAGSDALECAVDTDPIGHLLHHFHRIAAALLYDVGSAELFRERLSFRIPAEGNDPAGAQALGGDHSAETDGSIPDDGDYGAWFDARAHRGVVARAHHIGERRQRSHRGIGMSAAGNSDEGAGGKGNAHRLALASVNPVIAERTSGDALRCYSGSTIGACAIGESERRYDEVSFGDAAHLGADVLDNADELVPDRPDGMRRFTAVIPEVGAADAPQRHANDSIRRRVDHRVRPLDDLE